MRKQLGLFWIGFLSLLVWGFTTNTAVARDYSIDQYRINVNINKSGDAQVQQRITYNFDGAFNGVYYNQDIAGIKGLTDPSVYVFKGKRFTKLPPRQSGTSNDYQTTQTKRNYRFKVFYPASDETITFLYRYRLHGVITNWADTAELNWKIIGTGWDVPLNDVKISVQLPARKISKLQAWTHGPLNGQTQVNRTKGRVIMTVPHVPANEAVESHLLFPTSITADNTNRRSAKHLKAAQKQEAKLAAEANRQRKLRRMIPVIIMLVLLISATVHLIGQYTWFKRHPSHHVKNVPPVHNFEIPELDPVQAQSLLNRNVPNNQAFTAWLLELATAGEITITPETHSKTYRLTQTDKMTDIHKKDSLLHYLFNTIGKGDTVTLAEISNYQPKKRSPKTLSNYFEDWQNKQFKAVKKQGFFDTYNRHIKIHAYTLLIINLLITILSFIFALFLSTKIQIWLAIIFSAILLLISLIYPISKLRHLSPYTQTGATMAGNIKGFKQMLFDIGHFERSQVGDLILWEQILPYAVAFGAAKQVIKAMKANFTDAELTDAMPIYYPLFFYGDFGNTTFATQLNTDFSSSLSNSDSSSIGGSGGFSGGSSGGFGGGSGGGAF